jgi:hypothetical protein
MEQKVSADNKRRSTGKGFSTNPMLARIQATMRAKEQPQVEGARGALCFSCPSLFAFFTPRPQTFENLAEQPKNSGGLVTEKEWLNAISTTFLDIIERGGSGKGGKPLTWTFNGILCF